MTDRIEIVMRELSKCHPASFTNGGDTVGAILLPSDAVGVILCQMAALRLDMQNAKSDVDGLNRVLDSLSAEGTE